MRVQFFTKKDIVVKMVSSKGDRYILPSASKMDLILAKPADILKHEDVEGAIEELAEALGLIKQN